jgi:hypothetical protein
MLPVIGTFGENEVKQNNGRSVRAPLIVDGNQSLTMANQEYNWVWVKDDASLTIPNAVDTKINGRFNVTDNGSVIIEGDIEVESFTAHCKSVIIKGGYIKCRTKESTVQNGNPSYVIIHTQDAIEISKKGKIQCTGQNGIGTLTGKEGGEGGDGIISLMSDSYISISDESMVKSIGGTGGRASEEVNRGGLGGDGTITIQANGTTANDPKESIIISDSTIQSNGGSGGGTTQETGGQGGNGGAADIIFISISNEKISINKSNIYAYGGEGEGATFGINGDPGPSSITIDCKKLYVDEYKNDGDNDEIEWFEDEDFTMIWCEGSFPQIRITASNGAYLYLVILSHIPVAGTTVTKIYLYHTLTVTVKDKSGNLLDGADVTAKSGSNTESGKTDNNAMVTFLMLARLITRSDKDGLLDWTVTASVSGATGTYPGAVQLLDLHNYITIFVTLVTIIIESVEFDNKKYSYDEGTLEDGMTVYGNVILRGTAESSFTMDFVEIKIGAQSAAGATDTSSAKDWSTWSYTWTSGAGTFTSGSLVKIEAIGIAIDSFNIEYSDSDFLNLTVGDEPKAPGVVIANPALEFYFEDNDEINGFSIRGTASDPNWDSKLLTLGKNVRKVTLVFKKSGTTVLTVTREIGSGLTEDAANHTYKWSFFWNTAQKDAGGKFVYPNGQYTIEIFAEDDAGLISKITNLTTIEVNLKHIQKPTAVIKSIDVIKNGETQTPPYKREDEFKISIYKFQSKKGETEVTICKQV